MILKTTLKFALLGAVIALATGCVSSSKYKKEVSAYEQLQQTNERLRKQLAADEAIIQSMQDQLKVTMADTELFAEGSAQLSSDGKASLASIAPTLAALNGPQVIVRAFTDNIPVSHHTKKHFRNNLELSSARADTVVEFLGSKGVPMAIMSAQGFGEEHPIAGNDTADGRKKNRRVEIIISNLPITP